MRFLEDGTVFTAYTQVPMEILCVVEEDVGCLGSPDSSPMEPGRLTDFGAVSLSLPPSAPPPHLIGSL